MKLRNVVGMVVALLLVGAAQAMAADKDPGDVALGKYWFPKKNGQFEIKKEKGIYTGRVIAYDDADALDKHNPDPELAKRKFIGIEMLSDFKYDAKKNQWNSGTIYDGDSGKTYNCSLWFEEDDTSVLKGRGYIGVSLFGRTEAFRRVTAEDEKKEKEKEEAAAKEKESGKGK
ncbi:MAG TPA: DUF2147 domain-containing protein [Pirellulales bacterium]